MSLIDLSNMLPTEEAATKWFEDVLWAGERCCGKCGSVETREVPKRKPMPYWCPDCRSYFSVRTRYGYRPLQRTVTQVGHRHLPLPYKSQERVEHEAPPRPWSVSENRLVHAPPHP